MADVFHDGFETGGATVWLATTGSPNFGSSYAHSGNYGFRALTSGPDTCTVRWYSTAGVQRFTAYVKIVTTPDADIQIAGHESTGLQIYLTTAREIDFYVGGVKQADGTTQLNVGQWYRISGAIDASDDVYVWIDGVLEHDGIAAGSSTNWGGASLSQEFIIGIGTACTGDLYIDDIMLTTGVSSTDLGDIRVLAARPVSNGDDWDVGADKWQQRTGGSDTTNNPSYANLAEDPLDTDQGAWEEANSLAHYLSMDLDDCGSGNLSGIGGSDTIEAVNFIYYYKTGGGGTSAYYMHGRDSSGRSSNVELDDPKTPTWVSQYQTTSWDDDSSAWSQTEFNDQQMGMMCQDANKDLWWYEAYAMVAFKPPAAVIEQLTGQTNVAVSVSGSLGRIRGLSGTVNAGVSTSGVLDVTKGLSGQVDVDISPPLNCHLLDQASYGTTGFHAGLYLLRSSAGDQYIYLGDMSYPTKFLKINATDLSDYTQITFPEELKYAQIADMLYSSTKDKIYCLTSWGTGTSIIEVDPDTLAYSLVVDDETYDLGSGASFSTDESYIYVTCYGSIRTLKYNMSTWVRDDDAVAVGSKGHCSVCDGTNVFATYNNPPTDAKFAKIDPSDLSYEQVTLPDGITNITDDGAVTDNHVWVGPEHVGAPLCKFAKSDLSLEQIEIEGPSSICYGVFYLDGYIWMVYSEGALVRLDPATHKYHVFTDWDFDSNELMFDGIDTFFVTEWSNTRRVTAFRPIIGVKLGIIKQITGSVSASVSISGTLGISVGVSGQTDASVSITGGISVSRGLSGQTDAAISVTGKLSVQRPLAGQVDAAVTVAGDLVASVPLSGVVNVAVSVTGAMSKSVACSGQTDAAVAVTGALSVDRELSGQTDANVSITGTLSVQRALAGQTDASVAVSGSLAVSRLLSGSTDVAVAITGAITKSIACSGQIDADVAITGNLAVSRAVSGQIDSAVSVVGALGVSKTLAGQVEVGVSFAGDIEAAVPLSGAVNVGVSVAGELSVVTGLSGQVDVVVAVTGAMVSVRGLSGTSAATTTIAGGMVATRSLSGQTAGAVSIVGDLSVIGQANLSGQTDVSVSITGSLDVSKTLAGQTSASITIAGDLSAAVPLSGAIEAAISISGAIQNVKGLVGAVAVSTSVSGALICTRGISGQMNAAVAVNGSVICTRGISGQIDAVVGCGGTLSVGGISALQGQVLVAVSVSGVMRRQRQLIGIVEVGLSVTGSMGCILSVVGRTDITVNVWATTLMRQRGLSGTCDVTTSLLGALIVQWALQGACHTSVEISGQLASMVKPAWLLPVNVGSLNAVMART
jgi:hypothetical protein